MAREYPHPGEVKYHVLTFDVDNNDARRGSQHMHKTHAHHDQREQAVTEVLNGLERISGHSPAEAYQHLFAWSSPNRALITQPLTDYIEKATDDETLATLRLLEQRLVDRGMEATEARPVRTLLLAARGRRDDSPHATLAHFIDEGDAPSAAPSARSAAIAARVALDLPPPHPTGFISYRIAAFAATLPPHQALAIVARSDRWRSMDHQPLADALVTACAETPWDALVAHHGFDGMRCVATAILACPGPVASLPPHVIADACLNGPIAAMRALTPVRCSDNHHQLLKTARQWDESLLTQMTRDDQLAPRLRKLYASFVRRSRPPLRDACVGALAIAIDNPHMASLIADLAATAHGK